MKDIIAFLGRKRIIAFLALAFWAQFATVGSFFYPLLTMRIIEGVEQYRMLDMRLVAIYAGIMLSAAILAYFGTLAFNKYWIDSLFKSRAVLVADFFSLNAREKKDNGIGFYQNRINSELPAAFMLFRTDTVQGFLSLARLGFALYIGFLWDIVIGLIFAASLLVFAISAFLQDKWKSPVFKEMTEQGAEYSVFAIGLLRGIDSILNRRVVSQYLKKNAAFANRKIKLERRMSLVQSTMSMIVIGLFNLASMAALLAYSLHLYLQGAFSLGQVFAVLQYFAFVVDPIGVFNMIQHRYLEATQYIKRLLPVIQRARKDESEGKHRSHETLAPAERMLSVENLSYAANGAVLIDNFSLDIMRGEKVAIIGQSGEGKSALLDVLLKNFPDYEGRAAFMGRDLRELDRRTVLSNIGYYSQDIYVFNENAHDNVANDTTAEGEVGALLPKLGLEGLAGRLLGEDGVNISKGEKSRVEFMRLLLNDRPFAILDEPFDGLDAHTKEKMLERASEYLRDKTAVVISHDFGILSKLATKYVFIGADKKLSIGTHEELYGANAAYRNLYDKARESVVHESAAHESATLEVKEVA